MATVPVPPANIPGANIPEANAPQANGVSANGPLAPAIMARSEVRAAHADGRAVAVFSRDLSHIVWASHDAARLLKLSASGVQLSAAVENSAPVRQIRASRRMLNAGGSAKALIARSDRGLGAPLAATLDIIEVEGLGSAVLVAIAGFDARPEASRDAHLLAEAGGAATLYDETGEPVSANAETAPDQGGAGARDVPDGQRIAAFAESNEAIGRIETAAGAYILARVADDRVLLVPDDRRGGMAALDGDGEFSDASPRPTAHETAGPGIMNDPETGSDREAHADEPPPGRNGPDHRGLGALVERWYFRHQGQTAAPVEAAGQASSTTNEDGTGGAGGSDKVAAIAEGGTGSARVADDGAAAATPGESDMPDPMGESGPPESNVQMTAGPQQVYGAKTLSTQADTALPGGTSTAPQAGNVSGPSEDPTATGGSNEWGAARIPGPKALRSNWTGAASPGGAPSAATDAGDGNPSPGADRSDRFDSWHPSTPGERPPALSDRLAEAVFGSDDGAEPNDDARSGSKGGNATAAAAAIVGGTVKVDETTMTRADDGDATSERDETPTPRGDADRSMDGVETDDAERRGSTQADENAVGIEPEIFRPDFDRPAARFVWRIDADGRFRSVSPELAAAVGPAPADIVDRPFDDVARSLGIDIDGEVAALLARRDTWSGRTVLWPVENAAKRVPVDLAALPVYSRDRTFDGFRGFGVARLSDAVEIPATSGQASAISAEPDDRDGSTDGASASPAGRTGAAFFAALPEAANFDGPNADLRSTALSASEAMDILEMVSESAEPQFGRRDPADRPPHIPEDRDAGVEAPSAAKVIRLEERRGRRDPSLSRDEQAAFRAIGETLGDEERQDAESAAREVGAAGKTAAPFDARTCSSDRAGEPFEAAARSEGHRVEDFETSAEDEDVPEARGIAPVEQPLVPLFEQFDDAGEPWGDDDLTAQADDAGTVPPFTLLSPDADPAVADETNGAGHVATEEADGTAADATADPDEERRANRALFDELSTVYGSLPLPVLVQLRETLVYGNREFFDLTGYDGIDGLNEAGGLAHLYAEEASTATMANDGEMAVSRANGETVGVRTHMQRSTINGRSYLVMSFFATPRASASAIRNAAPLPGAEMSGPQGDDEAAGARGFSGDFAETGDEAADLRQTVEELNAVLTAATDGVVLLAPDGAIRSMNEAAHSLFGIVRDDAAGRPFVTLFAHESQKAASEYLESLRSGPGPMPAGDGREVIGRVAEGGFVPLQVNLGRLPGTRGWCAVIRDISRRKTVEEELTGARQAAEAASLHKSQFLANVSHELRTPLNAIIGFADVIATECFGPIGNERYLEYLDDIKRSGHHVLDLVNDLLDISKIEAGKLELAFEAVPLNEVMAEIVALMQPQANRERVLVRSNLPISVPPVVADRRSVRQIALNLVANAIRFTPTGGQIIVSTSYTPDGAVCLRFRDSGIGMSEDEIEIAVKPFQQVGPTPRARGEGTGLGLPLTKALVEANRAQFSLSSTPGEGTLVEILFPPQRVLAD